MSTSLAHARCAAHPEREAAAACRGCRHCYCRECVTESGGVMLCLRCLAARAAAASEASSPALLVSQLLLGGVGLLLLFAIFFAWSAAAMALPGYHLLAGLHAGR